MKLTNQLREALRLNFAKKNKIKLNLKPKLVKASNDSITVWWPKGNSYEPWTYDTNSYLSNLAARYNETGGGEKKSIEVKIISYISKNKNKLNGVKK